MRAILGALLGGLFNWIFRRNPEAKAVERAAKAETSLIIETKANADVQTAIEAARASDAAILLDPERLRDNDGFRRD